MFLIEFIEISHFHIIKKMSCACEQIMSPNYRRCSPRLIQDLVERLLISRQHQASEKVVLRQRPDS